MSVCWLVDRYVSWLVGRLVPIGALISYKLDDSQIYIYTYTNLFRINYATQYYVIVNIIFSQQIGNTKPPHSEKNWLLYLNICI